MQWLWIEGVNDVWETIIWGFIFYLELTQILDQETKGNPNLVNSQPMDWYVWSLYMGDNIAHYCPSKFPMGFAREHSV